MNRSKTPGRAESALAAHRPTWSRLTATITVIAATIVVIAGCGSTARSSTRPPATTPMPAACSPNAPAGLPAERWTAARQRLAPPGVSAIRLCRYSGLNAHPRLRLVSSRLLESPTLTLIDELVTEFDRLPSLHGAVACPNDDGSQILALLAHPGGRQVSISVGLSGSGPASA